MYKMKDVLRLPVTWVIDRFASQQLAEVGQQLQSLTTLPAITLVKQVPFFSAQFYVIPDVLSLEKQVIREATRVLSETLKIMGIRATYKVIRGSNPSQLSLRKGIVIQTMADVNTWLALLEESVESRQIPVSANG